MKLTITTYTNFSMPTILTTTTTTTMSSAWTN